MHTLLQYCIPRIDPVMLLYSKKKKKEKNLDICCQKRAMVASRRAGRPARTAAGTEILAP